MTDSLQLISTASLWFIHLILLVSIALQSAGKPAELKVATVFFLFYSLAALLAFEFDYFDYRMRYTPSPIALLAYIVADLIFLLASKYMYCKVEKDNLRSTRSLIDICHGNMIIVILALTAHTIHVIFNFDYLLLPKNEFIAEFGNDLTPNLLVFSLPAESILVGSVLFNPFRTRWLRLIITVAGVATLLLSIFQGYRHLVLIFALILMFRKMPRLDSVSLLVITIGLTLAGEMSNMIKVYFYSYLIKPDFDSIDYLNWYINNTEWLPVSTEQAAIASNFLLGLHITRIGSDFMDLLRLFPFTSSMIDESRSGASAIGNIVGIGYGQGTAYNFQVFLLNTLFTGGIFIPLALLLIKSARNSVLLVYALEVFYSLMRNTPSFWSGQMKLLAGLMLLVYGCNTLVRALEGRRGVRQNPLQAA